MELEFDKEMDALLRKATNSGTNADIGSHLDADEISIFAENALPEKAKTRVTKHLARCDECRLILANVISLNSEAVIETAPSAVVEVKETEAAITLPWHKKLFAIQNLAYGLGALAILFVGMIGFMFVQNMSDGNFVAKVNEPKSARADQSTSADGKIDNAPGDQNSNVPLESEEAERKEDKNSDGNADNSSNQAKDLKKDADVVKQESSEPQKPGNVKKTPSLAGKKPTGDLKADSDDEGYRKRVDRVELKDEAREAPKRNKEEDVVAAESVPAPPPQPKSEPSKSSIALRGATRRVAKKKAPKKLVRAEDKVARAGRASATKTRQISGKTFNQKNRVWYDSTYKGQKTTNIRRGTASFKKLDSGLRSIASKLRGTIVVVWKTKAYQIR